MKDEILKEFNLDHWAKWTKNVTPNKLPATEVKPSVVAEEKVVVAEVKKEEVKITTTKKPASTKSSTNTDTNKPVVKSSTNIIPLINLEKEVAACTKCELSKTRTNTVFARGVAKHNCVMIIGEGPGEEEDKQGIPFVGQAGRLLNAMLHAIKLYDKKDVYITNIVKCRPPNNRDPKPEEKDSCIGYLNQQIELLEPELIITLGLVATETLVQKKKTMGDYRNQVHQYKDFSLIPCYHPSYLMRSPSKKNLAWNDLLFIKRQLRIN